ncbi:hypothetical protein [Cellulomonas cellasea]|uniref:STAS domain-containing protein n=1 Tax=Cellulomonas cellasea TaxID=43670 RepID=A0A7W4YCC3_9CELL|nr:hypothetical protein [Cellulomonas cellasea]MBB2923557.1 hypothetical protein [Cellulomonas cellasea]
MTTTLLDHRAAGCPPAEPLDAGDWLTATLRPTGALGREDAVRLADVLGPLSASASLVIVDLGAARIASRRVAAVLDDAGARLEHRGGGLICVNVDPDDRTHLTDAGGHAVVVDAPPSAGPDDVDDQD